jgi:hypothetical protein
MNKSDIIKNWPEWKKAGTSLYSCSKLVLTKKEVQIPICPKCKKPLTQCKCKDNELKK